jgi:hypothetical protein
MITQERLDLLEREVAAAEDAYQAALTAERIPMTSRYQPTLLSPRVRALRDARDVASVRRYEAAMTMERAPR